MPKEDKKKQVPESDDIEEQSSDICEDCNKPLSECVCRDSKDNDDDDDFMDEDDFADDE